MKKELRWAAGMLWLLAAAVACAFETSSPEAEGLSSQAVLNWIGAVERDVDALHSFVLVRHGKVVAEGWWAPYEKDRPHMLYSLSKSFTSTAIGFAVDEGKLGLDDKVTSFFPDRLPVQPGENLMRMRVRDLLCMGSGNDKDTLPAMREGAEPDWVKVFLSRPVEHEPGTHFCYNTGATYMLAAILKQATGQSLTEFLGPRLFDPLAIKSPTWEVSPQGVQTAGYGLKVRTRDIAALGQLYLRKGVWNGKRLLSEKWIAAATSKQIANGSNPASDWNQGYGFQFWRCRHNAFRGDGAFGQYCVVMPDQDAVLAITSGLGNMQQVLDLVWANLLVGMKDAPLPPDADAQARLAAKLAALALRPVAGTTEPSDAAVFGKTFAFGDNEKGLQTLSLKRDGGGVCLALRNAHGDQRINCGYGTWVAGEVIFEKPLTQSLNTTNGRQPVAASGAWAAPDRYVADVWFRETPYRVRMTLRFAGDNLDLDLDYNVMFGPQRKWSLRGHVAH